MCTHSQDSFNVSFLSRYRLVVASIWAAWTDPQGAEVTTVALAITGTLSPTIKFLTTCVKIPFYFNGLCIYRKCTSLWSRGLEAFQFVVTLYLNNWKCAFVKNFTVEKPNFINVLTQALAFLLHKHSSYNSINIKPQIWSRSAFKVKKLKGYILQRRQITNPIAIMDISQEFGLTNEIFYKETFAA